MLAVAEPPAAGAKVKAIEALPLIGMICGELGASSEMVMVAERRPADSGRKVTPIEQVELMAIAPLQFGAEKLKSLDWGPESETLEM
jgi:hypothetical protein